jgi:hypothetical protein
MTLPEQRVGRGHTALVTALVVAVLAALFVPWSPGTVQARRYGRRYNYGAVIGRCKGGCGRTAGALAGCRKRFVKSFADQCRGAARVDDTACAGDAACRRTVRTRLRSCVKQGAAQMRADRRRSSAGACGRCCQKTKGGGDCGNYFGGSRFFGSSRYGRRLECVDNYAGAAGPGVGRSPGGGFTGKRKIGATDLLRARAVALLRGLAARLGG